MNQLREDYQGVYESISACCRGDSQQMSVSGSGISSRAEKDAFINSVLRKLTAKRNMQESSILEQMQTACTAMMKLKEAVAASKYNLTR